MNKIEHIQGLRALAVIAVFIFHINPDLLKGGYLGVDIFFVISGYIITKLLSQDSYQSFASLKQFFKDRIVRLLPNYTLMVIFTSIVAYWVLNPYDLIQYAKTLQFSGIYVTNVVLAKQQSYFDISRELKPLLHTWSLSIEWQFYITFSIIILFIKKILPKQLDKIILLALLASFLFKLHLINTNPNIAFYSFLGRGWQLLAGAYIACNESFIKKFSNKRSSHIALFTIIICLFITDESSHYQIYLSAICCVATGLVILATSPVNHFHNSLSNPVAIRLGDMSYAIYIWHWPIIVLIKNLNLVSDIYLETSLIIGLSLIMAWFSHQWIENQFRKNKKKISHTLSISMLVLSALIFGAIGHYYYSKKGLEERFPHAVEIKENRLAYDWEKSTGTPLKILPKCQINESIDYFENNCILGTEKKKIDFLILGDSHLEAIVPALHGTLSSIGTKGMIASLWGCPPLLGISNYHGQTDVCQQLNLKSQLDQLIERSQAKNIILVGFWNMYLKGNHLNGRLLNPNNYVSLQNKGVSKNAQDSEIAFFDSFNQTARYLQDKKITLFVLEDVPTLPKRIQDLPKNFTIAAKQHQEDQRIIQDQIKRLRQQGLIIQTIDLSEGLCSEIECFSYLNGHYLYWDHNHLTLAGASLTMPLLKKGLIKYQRQ